MMARANTNPDERSDEELQSSEEQTGGRSEDDRRGEVNPADNPRPRSPRPDEEDIRRGEEKLDRL